MPALNRQQLKKRTLHKFALDGDNFLMIREPTLNELRIIEALPDKTDGGPALVALIAADEDGALMFASGQEVADEIPVDKIKAIVKFFGDIHDIDAVEKN